MENREFELGKLKKIAKKTKNKQLVNELKKRIRNGNTVNKWQK